MAQSKLIIPTKNQEYTLGMQQLEQKHYAEALKNFASVLKSYPTYASALYGKGLALLKLKRFQEALNTFNELLSIVPSHRKGKEMLSELWIQVGYEHVLANKVNEADAAFKKALEYTPSRRDATTIVEEIKQNTSYEEIISPFIYKESFKNQYNALIEKHKNL